MPIIPFLALAGGVGWLAFKSGKKKTASRRQAMLDAVQARPSMPGAPGAAKKRRSPTASRSTSSSSSSAMACSSLVKEDDTGTDRLTEQIKALRRQLATELGFIMPPVRILDNMQLEPNDYKVKIKEVDAGHGQHLRQPADGDGPDGQGDHPARRPHDRADLRPARHLDRAGAARRSRTHAATRSSTPRR